ncbi:MAG: hypothetical protein H6700_08730 [Myxococcales bacterium]|nr:hypothetical protein [Myxococcales bacterium]MCB9520109.1 hypothetical protein [Myxococcales bacterium]MCB9531835.1 hypothetical protein [Myxococcales bacterium]
MTTFGAAMLSACGDGEPSEADEAEGTPLEEACEHHALGPFIEVTATPSGALGGIPDVSAEHTSVQVTLPGAAGAPASGYVGFAVSVPGTYGFFLTENVPLSAAMSFGGDITVTPLSVDGACDAVVAGYWMYLPVGTVVLQLGPTEASSVALVHERLP